MDNNPDHGLDIDDEWKERREMASTLVFKRATETFDFVLLQLVRRCYTRP